MNIVKLDYFGHCWLPVSEHIVMSCLKVTTDIWLRLHANCELPYAPKVNCFKLEKVATKTDTFHFYRL